MFADDNKAIKVKIQTFSRSDVATINKTIINNCSIITIL